MASIHPQTAWRTADFGERPSAFTGPPTDAELARSVDRTGLLAAMTAGIWGLLDLVGLVLRALLDDPSLAPPPGMQGLAATGVLGSAIAFVAIRRRWLSVRGLARLSVAWVLLITALVSVVDASTGWWTDPRARGLPWLGVLIVVFPLVLRARPATMVVLAVIMAGLGVAGMYFAASLMDLPLPTGNALAHQLIPTAACVGFALVPIYASATLQRDADRARQLGSYELVERIGAGGMGEVWRARHRMLVRPAAVKLIRPEALGAAGSSGHGEAIARFHREAQATAVLRSVHTVELYDFGVTDDGTLYYAMELLEGMDFEQLVARAGPLPPGRAIHLLRQVCSSLADAHDRGLVHRDIKPANLYACTMGSDPDFVKVLDFGLVKAIREDDSDDPAPSRANAAAGTPAYMAPETVTGEDDADHRVDLYALGCVAYLLLTGQPVFSYKSAYELAAAHVTEPPPPMRERGAEVPATLEAVVMRCLAKAPAERFTTAHELSRALAACDDEAWSDADASAWWAEQPAAPARAPDGPAMP